MRAERAAQSAQVHIRNLDDTHARVRLHHRRLHRRERRAIRKLHDTCVGAVPILPRLRRRRRLAPLWCHVYPHAVLPHRCGHVRVLKDGLEIATYDGPNAFNDAEGPNSKIGLYKWNWTTDEVNLRIAYYDDVRIFTEARPGISMELSLELSLKCSLELARDVTGALTGAFPAKLALELALELALALALEFPLSNTLHQT